MWDGRQARFPRFSYIYVNLSHQPSRGGSRLEENVNKMEKVWHYTTVSKFQAILNNSIVKDESNSPKLSNFIFWASDICAMNDPTEYQYGYYLFVNELLPQIEKKIGIKDRSLKLSQVWRNYEQTKSNPQKWHKFLINDNFEKHQTPFIISFSKQRDFLPMWNTYASSGNGIALGFNNYEWRFTPKTESDYDVEVFSKLHAKDVDYGEYGELPYKVILDLYKRYYEKVSSINEKQERFNYMVQQLSTLSVIASPYIKHKAYQYEEESRLIKFKKDAKDVKYRCNANGNVIPYIEIPIKKEYLVEIIIGPCANDELVYRTLKPELLQLGIDIPIEKSEVPYRIY